MDLSPEQIDDLTDLAQGALLVHQRSEAQWYLYLEGSPVHEVSEKDVALYLERGWVERQGFESALNLEMYALTEAGHDAIEPFLEAEARVGAPHLLLSAATAEADGETLLVAVPIDPFDVEQLRRRTVLAETLAAADEAFVALEYEAELLALDASRHEELQALLPNPEAHALVTALPESWHDAAGLEVRWASVLVGEGGFSFALELADGRRFETAELAEAALMEAAMTLMGAELGAPSEASA
ncbi:hypothetical protein [Truepera radiovictrix]|uniref:Uncharacterized protein n=1 Tax=Truepera radiovictrix (strain DSM 17093 / CIP 108686 / LMG 22925 / RQ-24) TaxID=649638 RepID=D7CXH7_TRURR|nr:hypothetical protein [Truepera radiovictrix]ADI14579.1 hypothetical protein Trad_1457 [Truepera radiovictrix DSM 17093]WMT56871.1 hypothetical protein RCV51_12740 [Truepera radiovictrix]